MWSDRILLSERLIKVKKLVLFSVVLGGRSGPYTERKVTVERRLVAKSKKASV